MIGQSNYFGFGFTTLKWKPLYFIVTKVQVSSAVIMNKETYWLAHQTEDPWTESMLKWEYQSSLISFMTLFLIGIAVCCLPVVENILKSVLQTTAPITNLQDQVRTRIRRLCFSRCWCVKRGNRRQKVSIVTNMDQLTATDTVFYLFLFFLLLFIFCFV